MRTPVLIGIVLIVLGVATFAFQEITYTTTEKVIDLGPIEATAETEKSIPLPRALGAISLTGGIVLVAVSAWRRND